MAFGAGGDFTGLLVVVWDDYIYEVIGPLIDERQGLLTEKSYSRDAAGKAERFPNIDGVLILRHLQYFVSAAGGAPLPDNRNHAMHIGDEGALPNVLIPVPNGQPIPEFITSGFGALPIDDPLLQNVADYRPKEFVFQLKY